MGDGPNIHAPDRDLLRYSDKDQRHRGEYKTSSNSVAAFDADGKQVGVVFETASPFETPRLMTELVAWLDQAQQGELHPLIAIGPRGWIPNPDERGVAGVS